MAWLNGEAAPANKAYVWLAGSLANLHVQWRVGADGAAAQTLARFVDQARTRAAAGAELGSEPEQILAQAELLLGDLLPPHSAAATAYWRAAAERLRAGPSGWPDDPARLALLAHALWRLGDDGQARALAERIERSPYRHPVYANLQQRLAMAPGGRARASPPRTAR